MLKPEALQAHIESGRHLFHVTPAQNVEAIMREGLRPGSELGTTTRNDFFRTRPGRVYLIRQVDLPIVEVGPEPRVFKVDLAQLDPELIDPDEDMVSEKFPDAVPDIPPKRDCDDHGNELPGQRGKLAAWAESIPDFDSPELAERSLEEGRISYRGTIPPSALELIGTPSSSLVAFARGLPDAVRDGLPVPPQAGSWRVEAARARALLAVAARGICAALGHTVQIRVADAYECQDTWRVLQPVIRSFYEEGRLEAGNAVSSAREAIRQAEELDGLPFPLNQLTTATEVAWAAGEAIGKATNVPELTDAATAKIVADAFASGARVTS